MDAQHIKGLVAEAEATADKVGTILSAEAGEGFSKRKFSTETVDAFVGILNEAADGNRRAEYALREAMVSADFPYLFGDVLDRSLMAQWGSMVPNWRAFCKTGTVRDFREAKRYGIYGMGAVLDAVGERAEYPERGPSEETPVTVSVAKYGARFGVSFETAVNDDLGALRDLPQVLALAARRTEALAVTNLYCGTTGPDGTLFTEAHKNIMHVNLGATTTNAPLSVSALGEGIRILNSQVDVDGFPIMIDAFTLVIPPALEVTANNILNATQIEAVGMFGADGASGNDATHIATYANNWLNGRVQLVVDPYIPLVATSSNYATSWFLFASTSAARPALEVTYLSGHESPELFAKAPNATRLGGGTVAESFETDISAEYKVRHIFGSTTIDYRAAFASNGSGS